MTSTYPSPLARALQGSRTAFEAEISGCTYQHDLSGRIPYPLGASGNAFPMPVALAPWLPSESPSAPFGTRRPRRYCGRSLRPGASRTRGSRAYSKAWVSTSPEDPKQQDQPRHVLVHVLPQVHVRPRSQRRALPAHRTLRAQSHGAAAARQAAATQDLSRQDLSHSRSIALVPNACLIPLICVGRLHQPGEYLHRRRHSTANV